MNTSALTPGASLVPSRAANVLPAPTVPSTAWNGIGAALRGGRPGLVLALALATTSLVVAWAWFGTAAVLPLLYVLPCAAMMAMCMKGHGSKEPPVSSTTNDPSNTGASA